MIPHTIIQLLIVSACLIHVQGNIVFNNSDEKLIIITPMVSYDAYVNGTIIDHENRIPTMSCNVHECFMDSCICSSETKCVCFKFEDAFNHVENNTVIAINGTLEEFTANIILSNISNISIIGYHKSVVIKCSAIGSLEFKNCNNIIIENITWISCGNNADLWIPIALVQNFHDDFLQFHFGLKFSFCTNINLKSCTFAASMVSIYEASGVICIDQVHFLSTSAYDIPGGPIILATGLIVSQTNMQVDISVVLKIINSLFSQTECLNPCKNLLLLYILVDDPRSTIQVLISQTNFSSVSYDPGWAAENGMVWTRILSSRDASIEFNEVQFLYNNFQLGIGLDFTAMLHVSSDGHYRFNKTTRVKMTSCTFINNYGNRIAYIEGGLYLDVMNTHFYNNKADSILSVTYSTWNDFITTALNIVHSTFSNNIGGHLMHLTGDDILVSIKGLQITKNILSSDNGGLIVFKDYDNIIADISNVRYESNYIEVERSGFSFTSNHADSITPDTTNYFKRCLPVYFHVVPPPAVYTIVKCFMGMYFQWYSIVNSSFSNNIGGEHGAVIYFNYATVELTNNTISTCTFNNNSGYSSLIYIAGNSIDANMIIKDSTFTRNEESVFYIVNQTLQFSNDIKMTLFDGNRAQNGAALYLDLNSKIIFTNNSIVTFSNNIAGRYGGAIYYEVLQSSEACYRNLCTFIDYYNASVVFNNNQARTGGNSIFFSISQACNGTLQYDAHCLNIEKPVGEIVMSPHKLRFYHPAQLVNNSNADINTYHISDIMLGQNIIIPACTVDLNEMPLWSTQFTIELVEDNQQNYFIQGNEIISVDCRTLQGINNLIITGRPPLINSTVTIQLTSFYDSIFHWRPISIRLNVKLSSCHSGFYYNSDLEHCVCYTTDNIVKCSGSNSTIRNGYWFGTINEQPTVTVCPLNYCNFDDCEASTGTCDLYPLRDNQCRTHRSGAACGNCEEGYTLSFDSVDCISKEKCNTGQTVLVITMSFLYWIAAIAVTFGIMYFNIEIGYLYGITFYYSIIDMLLEKTSPNNESVYQLVTILSSTAKLLPKFLGRLCFVEGMSGIDQQFIHYLHPLAVLLIVLLITIIARFSHRLSLFLSRVFIHGICLLLLLSYTSIASTTLLLIRSIRFTNFDKVYSYLSPDIEYFHGRHLIYVLIACLTGLVIVIGLPLLLSLEPFINGKINFIKIKPLLDQFQGCYKDKFRCFASYYMIFRLIILTIVVINATNNFVTLYLMLVSCSLMMYIHITVRPYTNNVLNLLDSFMLLILMLVISLLIIETYHGLESIATLVITTILIIMPLLAFLVMIVHLHLKNIKKFAVYCINTIRKQTKPADHPTANTENIELRDHDTVVDQQVRDRSTTTTM